MADWKPYSGLNVGNSLRVQIDPNNLRRFNYGNSDYNFPHTVSANYYWQLPFKSQNKLANLAIRGWAVSGALYSKSGEQFSIYDTAAVAAFGNPGSTRVLATYLGGPRTCGRPSSQANLTCLTASQFAPAGSETDFGNTSRNFFPFFRCRKTSGSPKVASHLPPEPMRSISSTTRTLIIP